MKQIKFIMLGLAGLLFGCQQAELDTPDENGAVEMQTVTISAGIGGTDTKASLDSQTGAFTWQSGDVISVLATDGKFYDFTLDGEAGGKEAEFKGNIPQDAEITTVATYPAIVANGTENTLFSESTLNYVLPAAWDYTKDVSNVPMVATFGEGEPDHMSFKQIGGVMRFPVKNLPKEATFIVTMHDKTITGQFPVDLKTLGVSCMTAGSTASELVINYNSATAGADAEFNVPVPAGTYNNFTVTIKDSEGDILLKKKYSANNKVGRATLLNMKELVLLDEKPKFTSLSLGGSEASDIDSKFISVKMPYGTDVSSLAMEYTVNNGTVSSNGVEVKSNSSKNFTSPVKFTITAENGAEANYYVSISYSGIPVVYINTKDAASITSKETWLKGTEIYVTNAGEHNSLYSNSQIKGRGNTTWGYHKKPYAIKLDSKEQVLGMPKHKRWVLLANYLDKTCIRNSIAFEISKRSSGIDWTPRGYHVDVVLNGVFMGNYYLCEQIKADENRVNLPDGGYLLEIDKNYDEVNKFYSPYYERPFMVKEPDEDELTPAAFEYIKNHVTEVEYALKNHSSEEDYLKYIDLDSFIDYWFVYELTATGEPTHPKSVYMWTDAEGKFHAGPVWDFDYFTFHPYYNNRLIFDEWTVWSNPILFDSGTETISGITHYGIPNKVAAIKARWNESREKYRTIIDEIDRQYALVKESAEYNAKMWPIDPVFYVPGKTYDPNREHDLTVDQSVARMKEFYQTHFEFMDDYINSL